MLPGNHIYNSRIDTLPVHPANSAWMATTSGTAPVNYFPSFPVNYVDKTSPTRNMVFYYQNTTPPNGLFQIPQLPDISLETGYYTTGGDNHLVTLNPQTCTVQEIYGLYAFGNNAACPACSSQSGVKYTANDFVLPATGTDAASMQLTPLSLHANEFVANGEIKHALRVTLAHPKCNGVQWPAHAGACADWYNGQIPMGGWARMKSSVNVASLKLSPLATVLALQMQRYGLIVADAGGEWQITTSKDSFSAAQMAAFTEITQKITGAMMEFVDTTGLQITDPQLLAAAGCPSPSQCGMANPSINPGDVVIATDVRTGAVAKRAVVLTATAVGVPKPDETFQAGASAQQMKAFVGGASDTSVIWSMTPSLGTLTPGGIYTPPASTGGDTIQTTTLTAASKADPSAKATILMTILPAGAAVRLYAGDRDYTDTHGQVWHPDRSLFPTNGYSTHYEAQWRKTPDIGLYQWIHRSYADIPYVLYVPNGNYKVTVKFAQTVASVKPGDSIFHLESQGQLIYRNVDILKLAGGDHRPIDFDIPAQVTDGRLYIAARHVGRGDDMGALTVSAIQIQQDASAPHLSIVSPDTGSITTGKTRQFYAVGWYMGNAVTWSISPQLGTIDAKGVYTSPANPTQGTVKITATSTTVNGATATASVTLNPGALAVTPDKTILSRGLTRQFAASIEGQRYSDVTWSAAPIGSITASGLYSAPDEVAQDTAVTVTAASKDNTLQPASAVLTVSSKVAPIRISCGDLGGFTDSQGRVWAADPGFISTVRADFIMTSHENTANLPGVPADMQRLYQSFRYGHADASGAYQFPVPNGSYTVTLYWGSVSPGDTTNMNVSINGTALLKRFNVMTASGKVLRAYSQSFPVTVTKHIIRIDLKSNWPADAPWDHVGIWISGIEILPKD
jgi:hypothetical protein